VSQQIITWLLFWPLLCLIAEQAVYFSGPARSADAYNMGAAFTGARASHSDYASYIETVCELCFILAARLKIAAVLQRNILIPFLLVLAASSALWSYSALITVQMSIYVVLTTLFALYLSVRLSTDQLMRTLMFMGTITALLSILFAEALPSYGIFAGYGGGAWQGICNHKNTLGRDMGFLLTPVFFTDSHTRLQKLLYISLLLFVLIMSQSKGAWLYTLGTLCFVGALHLTRRLRQQEALLVVLCGTAFAAVIATVIVLNANALFSALGKDPTMSGRTVIYREVWHSILKHPVLGYGYGAFWNLNPESFRIGTSVGWTNIGYSENGVLELALQLGLVGVLAVAALLGKAIYQGISCLRAPLYTPQVGWFVTILFYAALTNIDAGWLLTAHLLDWVLIVIACVGLNQAAKRRLQPARLSATVNCAASE
jgi:exopolysaccharide production protein ExoQ